MYVFFRGKSEGVVIQTIETIDVEQETDTPKPVKKRGRRPKVKEESTGVTDANAETVLSEVDNKDDDKEKCSSVENLIEMLEDDDDKDLDECIANDIEEDCSQKLIQPVDIKQEAIHPDLDNIENIESIDNMENIDHLDDDDDLDDNTMLDEDDSEYEGNDDSKNDNDGESNSPKKQKVNKNSMRKKAPEILIPQMVCF